VSAGTAKAGGPKAEERASGIKAEEEEMEADATARASGWAGYHVHASAAARSPASGPATGSASGGGVLTQQEDGLKEEEEDAEERRNAAQLDRRLLSESLCSVRCAQRPLIALRLAPRAGRHPRMGAHVPWTGPAEA
jgi:hypothetical protein